MNKVHVSASREYDIFIRDGIINSSGKLSAGLVKGRTAVLVSDDNVFPLYAKAVRKSYENAGFRVLEFTVPHGEKSKCMAQYIRLLDFLLESRVTRHDLLVALGGGVVGDLTGFAAATFQRGMGLVQIPTTLLAMVDSSVGGKTAVNLEYGKNQVGSFYQPYAVFCDPETLSTLPEEEFACGCAEVIKYAVLGSREFFDELKSRSVRDMLEKVISRCVSMKRDIVSQDEFDTGKRMLLNLGHTIGHAVEACSNFTVLHGQAVAVGMAVMSRAACVKGMLSAFDMSSIISLLEQYGLPTRTDFGAEDLYRAALSDKKASDDELTIVVPREIGRCTLEKIKKEDLRSWLTAGVVKESGHD